MIYMNGVFLELIISLKDLTEGMNTLLFGPERSSPPIQAIELLEDRVSDTIEARKEDGLRQAA